MPRLPEVLERESLPEEKREVFDYLVRTRGGVRLPFSAILSNPEVTYRVAHVGTYVRFESSLPNNVRELAVLTAARERDVRFEWAAHVRAARQVGVSEAAIDAIGHGRELDGLSDEEALPVRFARELLRDRQVGDATFAAARGRFGDSGVLDLTATIGYYALLGCLFNALEIEPAADAPQLP